MASAAGPASGAGPAARRRERPVAIAEPRMTRANPAAMPTVKRSLQDDHAEDGRDTRIDVGDDGRPHRADLIDERREDDERGGRAHGAQHEQGDERVRRGHRGRPLRRGDGRIQRGAAAQRQRHHARAMGARPAGATGSPVRPRSPRRPTPISRSAAASDTCTSAPTMARTPTRPTRSPLTAVRPSRSAAPVAYATTVPTSGVPAMSRPASELDRRCSAEAEQDPRDGDLDRGEGEHPAPPAQQRPEVEPGHGDRQQDRPSRCSCARRRASAG